MKFILAFWSVLAVLRCEVVLGQNFGCNGLHGPYLQCIKGELDANYPALEADLRRALTWDIARCFISEDDCYFHGYRRDILGRDGPLRDCTLCQKFAKSLQRLFLEADGDTKSCFRRVIRGYAKREAEYCLNQKYQTHHPGSPYISVPELPDFDEAAGNPANARKILFNTLGHVMALYDVDTCNSKGGPGDRVKACLDSPQRGYLHCRSREDCMSAVLRQQPGCVNSFQTTERFVCQCFRENREFLKNRVAEIINAIKQETTSRGCETKVMGYMVSPSGENWAEAANEALKCGKRLPSFLRGRGAVSTGGTRTETNVFRTVVRYGCRLAVSHRANAQQVLKNGLTMARYFIDAIFYRISRFCPGPCLEKKND